MNAADLKDALLKGLLELEQAGDLVVTHPAPQIVAEQLCARVVEQWGVDFLDVPIEAVIDTGLKSAAQALANFFNVTSEEATSAVAAFVRNLGEQRTPREVAELIAHQGAKEIAFGAFFCCHVRRGEYYSSDYLDWRKDEYARQRGR